MTRWLLCLCLLLCLPACGPVHSSSGSLVPRCQVLLLGEQTVPDIGAGQGVFVHGGFVYLYGDADTGIIGEYRLRERPLRLEPTGRVIRLTVAGRDVCPHPTGLTHHPQFGTFLGNTVNQVGTIFRIDWDRALADGTLDHAILNTTRDDAAVNGTRPEFVRLDNRWVIATSDYGDVRPALRLYDPTTLGKASATSEPGVVIATIPCGAFTQSLHWMDASGELVFVQNRSPGLLYRLVFTTLDPIPEDQRAFPVIDLAGPADELEGFAMLDGSRGLLLSSARESNVRFVRVQR